MRVRCLRLSLIYCFFITYMVNEFMKYSIYNAAGITISISSLVLFVLSYIFFGLGPLTALWIGLLIIGVSMALTPAVEGIRLSSYATSMILNTFENIARVVEGLGVRSRVVYKAVDGNVYIVIGEALDDIDPSKFIVSRNDSIALVFKSPISKEHLENIDNVCEAIDHVIIERLNLAESIECSDKGNSLYLRIRGIKTYPIKSLEKTTGSIYGIIAASIATLIKNHALTIDYEKCDSYECTIGIFEVIK